MDEKDFLRVKKYTEAQGTSGFEHHVRDLFKADLTPLVDEVKQDGLGGIFGIKHNQAADAPKIMFAAHMDEVGFIVTNITPMGLFNVAAVGGWNPYVVSSQRFTLFTRHDSMPVVSSSVSPHLLRGNSGVNGTPKVDDILFDAGFTSAEEAHAFGVRPGDFIVPEVATVMTANKKRVISKAWDNRFGMVTVLDTLDALKDVQTPNTLIMGADVQEEVGLRGAHGAVNMLNPDIFFAIDSSAADDINGKTNHQGHLDEGTLLRVFDPGVVMPLRLKEFVLDIAESNNIPFQYFVSKGGTDASAAQLQAHGVPSVALGVASRYIHTHQTMWSIRDFEAAKELVKQLAVNLDKSAVDTIIGR
ncbi:glutamyl aminopeptidase [Periweissella ghanensis]|uniref:Glutamyl aminopeptidase n=1 Tax=Periweissella ghanensis TaxID=467997 RepID=A0ABM8ZBD4_9LACO|nr:glutamyl aminopeptidase [Periweissella ghanensis]MCM0600750.1 glutamyl aminopeptidase [Periweissella ghanensis]CAH0418608.1 Glutamyl aminopeptidase [Periweissella ghanensis]